MVGMNIGKKMEGMGREGKRPSWNLGVGRLYASCWTLALGGWAALFNAYLVPEASGI